MSSPRSRCRISEIISGGKLFGLIGHYRNVRGLGKSMVVFRLFEELRYSNERSTKFEGFNHE